MIYLFAGVCLLIAVLIFFMFLILKNAVTKINAQTKAYFVDKLQVYDYLINEKEEKLNQIDKLIKDKELGIKEEEKKEDKTNYSFDYNIIDLLNETKYQDQSLLELNRIIDEKFNFDYESIVKKFIKAIEKDNNYEFCVNFREKFTSDLIYELEMLPDSELIDKLESILDEDEFKVYEMFIEVMDEHNIERFVEYLNQLVTLNNPNIVVLVGNEKENYDHISSYITTKVSKEIFRGIKIIYRDRIYDFSLNERNI